MTFYTEAETVCLHQWACGEGMRMKKGGQVIMSSVCLSVCLSECLSFHPSLTVTCESLVELTPWSRILLEKLIATQFRNSQPLMGHEGSLSRPQKPATGSCSELVNTVYALTPDLFKTHINT
jgi:hypothetical protein